MPRTAFALALTVGLMAACGDDDGGFAKTTRCQVTAEGSAGERRPGGGPALSAGDEYLQAKCDPGDRQVGTLGATTKP